MENLVRNLPREARVLDLGAGGGSFPYAATQAGVIALDQAFPADSQPCLGRIVADAWTLPLKGSSVDRVVCNNTLEHFECLDAVLFEIDRVVRTGGRLWAAVPDSESLDDRLYRFIFRGGGHVNRFSLQSLVSRIESRTGFRARICKELSSGFVYLNPPESDKLRHYPRPARFLSWIPPALLRTALRWLNYTVRRLDRLSGSHLSRYGWAVVFEQRGGAPSSTPTPVGELDRIPAETNVCFVCGAPLSPQVLRPLLRRFFFWKTYQCPRCGTTNLFFDAGAEKTPTTENGGEIEKVAREIFGSGHPDSVQRWVRFWKGCRQRGAATLKAFRPLALLDFQAKKVLDIGCGTGELGELIGPQCQLYVGGDAHSHVLQFTRSDANRHYVRCNGVALPFSDHSFDYIFALDVLEHVVGADSCQIQFLLELRRVLRPLGMIFFTTPNRWYPYEGHTHLYFPQYLPLAWSNRYIKWRNPGFLKEHKSFAEIRSLGPRALRACLKQSRLSFLHSLPCGLDRPEFLKMFPIRGLLAYGGIGWLLHAEFWGILVRKEMRKQLRRKLRKNWSYEHSQPSPTMVRDFRSVIDFDRGFFNQQLGRGWYWHEKDSRGFRWIGKEARCYLETHRGQSYLRLHGYTPRANRIELFVNGVRVGEHQLAPVSEFRLEFLAPFPDTERIWELALRCSNSFPPENPKDQRELALMIFSVGLFDRGRE
ncbi:MAG: methyltransferase domain-containing protein [Acidobacteriota bacterium]